MRSPDGAHRPGRSRATKRRALCLALVVGAQALTARHPVAWAESAADADARRLAAEGAAALRRNDYDGAIAAFEAAYARRPAPALFYDLGQAYRLKGDCEEADAHYRAFLAAGADGRLRTLTLERLGDLASCVAKALSGPPKDDEEARDEQGQDEHEHERMAGAGALAPAREDLGPRSAPAAASAPALLGPAVAARDVSAVRQPAEASLWPWITGAASVGFLSAGGLWGWSAKTKADEVSRRFEQGGTWDDGAAALDRQGRRDGQWAVASLMAGAAAAGITAWLIVRARRELAR